jgi:hypothetical protein
MYIGSRDVLASPAITIAIRYRLICSRGPIVMLWIRTWPFGSGDELTACDLSVAYSVMTVE